MYDTMTADDLARLLGYADYEAAVKDGWSAKEMRRYLSYLASR